jgi:predicted AlkP superfamily phosphohydrolase/phosphomutase
MSDRLLVVCFDGGEPRVVRELLAAGELPTLRGILERGASVEFDAPAPLLEECSWAALLTGRLVGDVALAHFLEFDPATMGLRFRREANSPGFWDHLPPTDGRLVVLDAPELHPWPTTRVETSCNWMPFGDAVHRPSFTTRELEEVLGAHGDPLPIDDAVRPCTRAEDEANAVRLDRSTRLRFSAALAAARGARFCCVGSQELHSVVHCLGHNWLTDHWHMPYPREPALVLDRYRVLDEALAPLVDEFADGHVAVVFTHGMRAGTRAGGLLEELFVRAGLLTRRGPERVPGARGELAWATHRLRTLLPERLRARVARALLPERTQHRLASRRFSDAHIWSQTQIFPVPGWTTGFLRANVRGREAGGVVEPEALDALLELATELLLETENAETGEPLVRTVIRAHETYPGDLAASLPDLLVDWAGDRPATRARHPRFGEWEAPLGDGHLWTSHSDGVLALLAGPRVEQREGVVTGDAPGLAPTLLALLGATAPEQLPGKVWDIVAT